MKRITLSLALLCVACAVSAQEASVLARTEGDFNKDGIVDEAVITRPEGCTQPTLTISLGTADGGQTVFGAYTELFDALDGDDLECSEYTLSVNAKDSLIVSRSMYSALQIEGCERSYVLRLQDGDFYCIGMSHGSFWRSTGEREVTSYNFLTGKKATTLDNLTHDGVKPTTTWESVPKEPLKRIGELKHVI